MKYQNNSIRVRWQELEGDPALRRKIAERLYRHLSDGYSENCFEELSAKGVQKCLQEYPEEFILEDYESACRRGQRLWEGIGRKQASGECQGNSRTWFYNMSNRYGWSEKADVSHDHSGQVTVNVMHYSKEVN